MNPAAIFVFSFGCGRGSFEGLAVTGRSVANAVFSVLPGEGFPDLAGIFGVFSGRSRRKSGNRHFPSEFCGQTTLGLTRDRKSTRLNSSHVSISYAVFCLKKKK